jgi:GxxExxY protein
LGRAKRPLCQCWVDRALLGSTIMDLTSRPVGVTRTPIPDDLNRLSAKVIGCAIEVHRALGPGLLESAYDGAFCIELGHQRLQFLRQLESPIAYRDQLVGAYRLDFLVEDALVAELKSVERLEYVYVSQMLTYLKATGKRLGLILNFNVPVMKAGVRRVAL